MIALPRRLHVLLILALGLPLAACTVITEAPAGSPRVEAELIIELGPSFDETLSRAPGDNLEQLIARTILASADLGLRLYPVLSTEYTEDHSRPVYSLEIELDDFHAFLEHTLLEGSTDESLVRKEVDYIVCTATATFKKNRDNGPKLVVAQGVGFGKVDAETALPDSPITTTFQLRSVTDAPLPLAVSAKDIGAVVRKAVLTALKQIEMPVDREFSLLLTTV